MKYLMIIISFIALGLIFNACQEDFLDRTPLDEVTSVDYFKQPEDLKTYLVQFYKREYFPVRWDAQRNAGSDHGRSQDLGSDNEISVNPDTRLEGTRVVSTTGGLPFGDVRQINFFFDNYRKVEESASFDDYKTYLGEAYFFRAMIYFHLLRTYGDIQWITSELNMNSPELYSPRDARNIVADNIIAALDTAAMYLTTNRKDGASRVYKWMALLMQSRIALYEGTWQKYHANTPFGVSNPQPEKYFNKAVEAATQVMESGDFEIYSTGDPSSDYYDLHSTFRDYSTNKEVLFWKKFSIDLGITNAKNYYLSRPAERSITKQLADSYLCTDGKPISGNSLFQGYTTISDEMQNRDPRFFQTIATPDFPYYILEDGTIVYWSWIYYDELNTQSSYSSPAGYILLKGYNPHFIYHSPNFEDSPSIILRYAEVLLNYAEAKAELGTITQTDIDMSVKLLRDRAGMPNLILSDITADPNWDFPDLSPIINEIRRERRVELATEGLRWDDIARWAAADELIVGKRPKGFLASQITTINPFPVDVNGFLDPYQNILPMGYGFKLDRDYLNSIPESEIVLNPNMTQNPGW